MTNFNNDIEKCLEVLQRGGTILYPTDTIWGIGCDATNETAVEKIYRIKKRKEEKSLIVLLANERDIITYVTQPDLRVFDYLETTTKPTTVIYDGAVGLAANLINKDGSVAIRIVKDEFCRHLVKRFRKPIVSTSANISGHPAALTFSEIDDEIKNAADHIVQYRQEEKKIAAASAIIRWTKNGTPDIIRP